MTLHLPSLAPLPPPTSPACIVLGDGLCGAELSRDRLYRYRLWRIWDTTRPLLLCAMINPSTADHEIPDRTASKVCKLARAMTLGGVLIVNAFAWRATDPDELYVPGRDIIGPDNDAAIESAVADPRIGIALAGWGAEKIARARQPRMLELIRRHHDVRALRVVGGENAAPGHPLFLPDALRPAIWWPKWEGGT